MQVSRGPRYVMSQPGGDEDDRLMLGHPLEGLDRVKLSPSGRPTNVGCQMPKLTKLLRLRSASSGPLHRA
jgi:hypothetical protein